MTWPDIPEIRREEEAHGKIKGIRMILRLDNEGKIDLRPRTRYNLEKLETELWERFKDEFDDYGFYQGIDNAIEEAEKWLNEEYQ